MIPDFLYKYIYHILIAILTIVVVRNRRNIFESEPIIGSLILCVFMIFFIGFRPHTSVFVDTKNYADWWGLQYWTGFDTNAENLLFDNLYIWMSNIFLEPTIFFLFIASLYFSCMLIACRKLFEANTFIAFLVCLAAFSTFSYGTNGIKAGLAASLFVVALAFRDKMAVSVIFLLLSWGCHHSMVLPVGAYLITLVFKDSRWYFYGWLFCLLMAAGHVTFFQNLFAGMSDDSGNAYLTSSNSDWGGKSGFRIDFVLYSTMPVLMGYFVIFKYQLRDFLYENMLHYYLVTNSIWMLCMYGSFTNRIAYLSWFAYPFLIIYPCFAIPSDMHPLVVNRQKFIYAHLSFSLLMWLVIYK